MGITYSECVCVSVALVIQHAKRMRRIILWSVAWPAVAYFSTVTHKWHDFRGRGREGKLMTVKCVFYCLYNFLSETFLTRREELGEILPAVYIGLLYSNWYSGMILMETEFPLRIFEMY